MGVYQNARKPQSGNFRPSPTPGQPLSRQDIELLFENSDAPHHFVRTAAAMWRAAGKPTGREILLFAAVDGYRIEGSYRSRRAVQYNLRGMQEYRLIEVVYGPNTVRRPTTYRLCIPRFGKRQTYTEAKAAKIQPQRESHSRHPHHSNGHAKPSEIPSGASSPESPTAPGAAAERQPPPTAPVREQPKLVDLILDGSRKAVRLRQLRIDFRTRVEALIKGHERYRSNEGEIEMAPNHPDYRLPMPRDQAIEKARIELGMSKDEAQEFAKEDGGPNV